MAHSFIFYSLLLLGADNASTTSSEMAQQARRFFDKLIDFKVEKGLLVVHPTWDGSVGSNFHNQVRGAFPGMGRVQVRHAGGSSSMNRGSGGSVSLSFAVGGNGSAFSFELQSTDGTESMRLAQSAPGSMTLEYTSSGATVSYAQESGKCQLKIRARGEKLMVTRKNFDELFQENPEVTQKHFIGLLEAFFDKVPFAAVADAPPGKVVFRLLDGARLVGEMQESILRLETAYGALEVPWSEIRHIAWIKEKPTETVVTTARFVPRGKLEIQTFELVTVYGKLRVQATELAEVAVGPPLKPNPEVK